MKLSIIIPVFNEEKTIAQVLKRLGEVNVAGVEKEVIVVDDGSTDSTESVISNFSRQLRDPASAGQFPTSANWRRQASLISNFKKIRHERNLGKGAAIRTGIERATGDYVLIQDADLEYDPKDIQRLLKPILTKKAKVVYGTRLKRLPNLSRDERTPRFLLHYFGNRILSFLTSVLYGQWITDMETGYKLFPKKALTGTVLSSRSFDFEPEITAKLLKKHYAILEIPITTNPRGYDEGKKLNTFRDGIAAFWTLVKYRFIN